MWRFIGRPHWVDDIVRGLRTLNRKLELIMASQAENQASIDALAAQADKAKAEIVDAVTKLEEAAANGQELDFTALRTAVGGLDELNPDAPVESPGESTETPSENQTAI